MSITTKVDAELERLDFIIRAAEDWSPDYRKDKKNFQHLLKAEIRFEQSMRKYFRELADRSERYVDWYGYTNKVLSLQAADEPFNVEVIINDSALGDETGFLIQYLFAPIEEIVELGGQAAEFLTGRDIGISRTSELVQRTAKEQVAFLVGKRVTKDGVIVDNPNAKYRVTDTVRKDIQQSIATSLSLREDQQAALKRMKDVISNPKRAELIARTETVNAYQGGVLAMGKETGAVGKEWQTLNYEDICGVNARQGVIPIGKRFASGQQSPVAHPNCRCTMRLVYPEDPSAQLLDQPTSAGEDLTVSYHGSGHNLNNGNYMFGDAYYVSRSKDTASQFGKVKEVTVEIPSVNILFIDSDQAYRDLVAAVLRAFPGENLNQAFPKYILQLGYKAVEMSPLIDPLGGIAIVDPNLVPG